MTTRTINIELSDDTAALFDAALTGNDDDILLTVEKTIVGRLYPDRIITGGLSANTVDTDPDLVNVIGADGVENKPVPVQFTQRCGCGATSLNQCAAAVEGYYTTLGQRSDEQLHSLSKDDGCVAARVLLAEREREGAAS